MLVQGIGAPYVNVSCAQVATHEVGFFLAWRLLSDLIQSDPASGTVSGDNKPKSAAGQARSSRNGNDDETDDEDVSLRRITVTFFRTEEGNTMFQQFISRCVDVVVDGSEVGRKAAAAAAHSALQIESVRLKAFNWLSSNSRH